MPSHPNNTQTLQTDLKKALHKATTLSTAHSFPLSLFYKPDYFQSAEYFQEAGDLYIVLNDNPNALKVYLQACNLYLKCTDAYGKSYAAHCYSKRGDLSLKMKNLEEAATDYQNSSLYFCASGNYALAGSKATQAGKCFVDIINHEKAEESYRKAIEYYDLCGMKSNKEILYKEYVLLLVKLDKYSEAGDIYLEMGSRRDGKIFLMLAYLCYFVCENNSKMEGVWECFSSDEKEVFGNRAEIHEKAREYLSGFVNDESVDVLVGKIQEICRPENDIL